MVKSVGYDQDNDSHGTGMETVAAAVGLGEYIDASVFPLVF